ncbi:MAG: SpoIIE family protein phosphatase, partial [Desulfobacterales bacterium]|nr:SpoIIE family protein phosphatase [Desulfobacterales bacterium]
LPIEEGFQFYLATDGFWDQLGGDKGLRFGMQRFMTLLQTSQTMPMAERKAHLLSEFQSYRGNRVVQDDLTVMGFSII